MGKLNKIKTLRRIFVLALIPFITVGSYFVYQDFQYNEVEGSDPLIVTYNGAFPPQPVFEISNMLPGDESEKTFNIENDSSQSESVKLKGIKESENKDFSEVLEFLVLDENDIVIYNLPLKNKLF
jgi:hypothetical protein